MIASGCSTGWIQTAISDAPIVLQIVLSILSIVDVKAIPAAQSAGSQAQQDLALLQKYLADYKTAQANSPQQSQALTNIQAALTAAQTDLNAILAAIHVSNPQKQQAIAAGLGVALTVLAAIESLIPKPAVTGVKATAPVALLKPAELKRTYNAVISTQYPGSVLP